MNKKNNDELIDMNDPTNIKIVDFDIIKTITQQFYNSTHSLYKPLIRNEYPNLYDVKIDDNTIKLMNEEEYKKDKKIQRSI